MEYTKGLGSEDINTFSVCVRFNVEYLLPRTSSIFTYSTFIYDNALELRLYRKEGKLSLRFCRSLGASGTEEVCNTKIFKSIHLHNDWHHTCWLLSTDGIDSEKIKLSTKLFFDGKEVNQGDALLINSHLINETHKYTLHCRYTFCRQR